MGSGFIRCQCRPAGNLAQDFAIRKLGPSRLSSVGKVNSKASTNTRAAAVTPRPNNDARRFGGLGESRHPPLKVEQLEGNLHVPGTSPRSVVCEQQSLKNYGFI